MKKGTIVKLITLPALIGLAAVYLTPAPLPTPKHHFPFTSSLDDVVGDWDALGNVQLENGVAILGQEYVYWPDGPLHTYASQSFSVWFEYYDVDDQDKTLFSYSNEEPTNEERLDIIQEGGFPGEGFRALRTGPPPPSTAWAPVPIVPDRQYHVVLTLETFGEMAIYVNGRKLASGACGADLTLDDPTSTLYLGYSNFEPVVHFFGEVDEFSIWDVALTESEVKTLFERGPQD